MTPETVSQLQIAVAQASAKNKNKKFIPSIEADPAVIDCVLKSDEWRKDGYFIYQDVRVYGKGYREAAEKREKLTHEERVFGHSQDKPISAPSPFFDAARTGFEGQ